MDFWRNFLWLWVIIVIIFAGIVISLLFIFINKCISRAGKHRITQFPRTSSVFTVKSNQYQERTFKAETPPLPPRTQFLTAEAQSYENLAEEYVQNFSDYEQSIPHHVQDVPDYEQDKQSDYVKLEDEEDPLTLPPLYQDADPAADNTSTEDYDDIGGKDENEDDEDYDDVA